MHNPDLLTGNEAETYALDWCNQWRRRHNLPEVSMLFKGEKGSTCDCPIANTLMHGMEGECVEVDWRMKSNEECDPDNGVWYVYHFVPAHIHRNDAYLTVIPPAVAWFIEEFEETESFDHLLAPVV